MSRTVIIAYCCVALVYAFLVTHMEWQFFGEEWLGVAFDSLGEHLLRGEADVDPDSIKWEALKVGDKSYAYQGPFPALVRIIANYAYPAGRGQWSRLSCFLAALLTVVGFGLGVRQALATNASLTTATRRYIWTVLVLGFSFGTPIITLISCARIYHEPSLWGLCGSMWGLFALVRAVLGSGSTNATLSIFSFGVFVALLSRTTFGLPLVMLFPILFLRGLPLRSASFRYILKQVAVRASVTFPATAALGISAWYNWRRFGNPLTFFYYPGFYHDVTKFGGELNVSRIPSALLNYFGIFSEYVSALPPYFRMRTVEYLRPELYVGDWREQVISCTFASPWLVVGAIAGIAGFRRLSFKVTWATYVAAFSVEAFIIASYFFVTQRYAADFLPILTLLLTIAIVSTPLRARTLLALSVLVFWSSVVTAAATLDWNMAYNGDTPTTYKQKLRGLFIPTIDLPVRSGKIAYLSDLAPTGEKSTFAPMARNMSALHEPFSLGEQTFPSGIGMHAHASVTYQVPPEMRSFTSILAISPSMMQCNKTSLRFRVRSGAGAILFESGLLNGRAPAQLLDLSLGDAHEITLEVDGLSDGYDCDHGNWIMANFNQGF